MSVRILEGDTRDVLRTLHAESVQCVVTSPPYFGLRDYGHAGQIGQEATPADFVDAMVQVFGSVRRALRDDGVVFLNLGDSYAGSWGARGRGAETNAARPDFEAKHGTAAPARNGFRDQGIKPKDLLMIPARVAIALQADGWFLRSDIIWHKPNPMPESVTDRPTSAHEHVFLLTKRERYFYDAGAIAEASECTVPADRKASGAYSEGSGRNDAGGHRSGGFVTASTRNARNVWTISTQPYSGAHFATMPPELAERCIRAGSRPGDTILDPFSGAGTTALVADRLQRNAIGIELNPEYARLSRSRITQDAGLFGAVA